MLFRSESDLDLVVAGHREAIVMVEASARELPEAEVIDALELAHEEIRKICAAVDELRELAGKPKEAFAAPVKDAALARRVSSYAASLRSALSTSGKEARHDAIAAVEKACLEDLLAELPASTPDEAREQRQKEIKGAFSELAYKTERLMIVDGLRVDGRKHDEIREITVVPDFIARHHGSALFTRGETQALVSCTLGTPDDEQIIDGIEEEYKKAFYLHYNFPPYSVGEVRRLGGPGRREIGHGMLAERALASVQIGRAHV